MGILHVPKIPGVFLDPGVFQKMFTFIGGPDRIGSDFAAVRYSRIRVSTSPWMHGMCQTSRQLMMTGTQRPPGHIK